MSQQAGPLKHVLAVIEQTVLDYMDSRWEHAETIVAIIAIATIQIVAMRNGVNHNLHYLTLALLGALGGVRIGQLLERGGMKQGGK